MNHFAYDSQIGSGFNCNYVVFIQMWLQVNSAKFVF